MQALTGTPERVIADEMVGIEFGDGRHNHIKKFLNMNSLL